MSKRARRRHQQRVAKIHHDNIYIHAYGWRSWMDPWRSRRYNPERQHYRPMSKLLMTESGHKHWRKVQMTAPDRAQEHQQLRLVERGLDPELFRWPDHKKPFVYFW